MALKRVTLYCTVYIQAQLFIAVCYMFGRMYESSLYHLVFAGLNVYVLWWVQMCLSGDKQRRKERYSWTHTICHRNKQCCGVAWWTRIKHTHTHSLMAIHVHVAITHFNMLGWERRFISWISLIIFLLFVRHLFIFSTITSPVILCFTYTRERERERERMLLVW